MKGKKERRKANLDLNLTKYVQDIYVENYKFLVKEILKDLSKRSDVRGLEGSLLKC